MYKKTVVDQIEITRSGAIQVRLKKLMVDGDVEYDLGYHRTVIPFGGDPDVAIGIVNTNLEAMGVGSVPEEEMPRLRAVVKLINGG